MNYEIDYQVPNVFVKMNGQIQLVSSMVLSTLSVLVLATFLPQLMPLWIAGATKSWI